MKYYYSYRQHAVVECSGYVDVPDHIVAQGEDEVRAYVDKHEVETDTEIMEYFDRVPCSSKVMPVK